MQQLLPVAFSLADFGPRGGLTTGRQQRERPHVGSPKQLLLLFDAINAPQAKPRPQMCLPGADPISSLHVRGIRGAVLRNTHTRGSGLLPLRLQLLCVY